MSNTQDNNGISGTLHLKIGMLQGNCGTNVFMHLLIHFHNACIIFRFMGRPIWSTWHHHTTLEFRQCNSTFNCIFSCFAKKGYTSAIWRWTWLFTHASGSTTRIESIFYKSVTNFISHYVPFNNTKKKFTLFIVSSFSFQFVSESKMLHIVVW